MTHEQLRSQDNVPKKTNQDMPTCCFSVLASTLALIVPTSPLLAFNLLSVSSKWPAGHWFSGLENLEAGSSPVECLPSTYPKQLQNTSKDASWNKQFGILTELPFRLGSVFAATSPLELLDLVLQMENLFLSGFQLLWRMGMQQQQ